MNGPVLVTGGAGYIGSHVCKALAEANIEPVCVDSLEKGHDWAVRWGPLEEGDIGDGRFLEDVFRRRRPRAVIHLAGYIEIAESMSQPQRYMHNNAGKTHVLIGAALRHGVEAFVFSSTCAVYGLPQGDMLDEVHRLAPINPYASSKASVERALQAAAWRGLRSASLRYFNASGADPGGLIGEAHEPETHLIPLAIDAALGLRPPLVVHGSDYPTDDGFCVRDYVHVTDLAEAHLRAVRWLLLRSERSGFHEPFNLGSGIGYSVRQVIDCVGQLAGHTVPHVLGARRTGDSPRLVGCVAKAREFLDWIPTRGLDIQIEDALRWRRSMAR